MMRLLACILVLSCLQVVAETRRTAVTKTMTLWDGDSVLGAIYYPANAEGDSPERQVAEDLARILEVASGNDWSVGPEPQGVVIADGIFIGSTIRARIDRVYGSWDGRQLTGDSRRELLHTASWERTTVLTHPRRLVINGSTPEATRSGVYRFLQEVMECQWGFPGVLGERIPSSERFALRVGTRDIQPDYLDRKFLLGGRLKTDSETGLWALRNGASQHFNFNHELHRIITRDVLAKHPEWRAWRFGKRTSLSDVKGNGSQPDLLEPELVEYVSQFVKNRAEASPDLLTVSIGTNDSIRYDDSPRTRDFLLPFSYFRGKPNYSDLVFGFSNAVAESASQMEHPPVITQLAYMWTELPPSFPVAANLMPYICTDQSQWYDSHYRAEDEALIDAWGKSGVKMFGAWEYYQGQPYIIPRYFPQIESASVRYLYDQGARGIFYSGNPVWGFDAPKYWLAGQLAWDVDINQSKALEGYFKRMYGPAAEAMTRFFAYAEEAWMSQPGEGMWLKYWNNADQFALYPAERRALMSECLDEARHLALTIDSEKEQAAVLDLIAETESAWAVTLAGAELYDAWMQIGYPGMDSKPTVQQIDNFRDKQRRWLSVDRDAFPRSSTMLKLVDGLDPLSRWSNGWQSVAEEDFTNVIFEGDLDGGGPESVSPSDFRRGWATMVSHAEGLRVKRILEPFARLRIEGADYCSIFRWLDISDGVVGDFKLEGRVRGHISPGSQMELVLYFMDAEGKTSEVIHRDRLKPGYFPEWIVTATECEIPLGSVRVYTGVRVSNQYTDDWLEIESIDLQFRKADSSTPSS